MYCPPVPAAFGLASQASRRRLAGHHSPRAWTAMMMFLVLMLCGPHSSERGPQAMPRFWCGNTVEPGRTRGKMTELLLSVQVSFPARRSRMLHTGPSLLKGFTSSPSRRPGCIWPERVVGLGLNDESRRNQVRLAPEIGRVTRVEPRQLSQPRRSSSRAGTLCQTTLPGFDRRAAI